MKDGFVNLKIASKIATLSFFHPQSNSMPSYLLKELIEKFDSLSEDESVNVIVLKSEGEKAFCAGASFDELMLTMGKNSS